MKFAFQLFVTSRGTAYNEDVLFGDDVLVDIHNFPSSFEVVVGHRLSNLLHIAVACQCDVCSLVGYFQYLLRRLKITYDLAVVEEQRNGEIKCNP